ncbi:MAG: hypothetical protein ACPGO5_01500 [Patescibacteria group bacterium]
MRRRKNKRSDRRIVKKKKRSNSSNQNGKTGVVKRDISNKRQRCCTGSANFATIKAGRKVNIHEIQGNEALISLSAGKKRWIPKNEIEFAA